MQRDRNLPVGDNGRVGAKNGAKLLPLRTLEHLAVNRRRPLAALFVLPMPGSGPSSRPRSGRCGLGAAHFGSVAVKIRRRVAMVAAAVLVCPMLAVAAAAETPASSSPASFSFAAAGDFGANANTSKVLTAMAGAQVDFGLALGDLSYGEISPESAWCDYVQSQVGGSFPFELVAGNHDANGSTQGQIANFAGCLPHRLSPLTGVYGQQYYFDYPADPPLARFIMISPNLAFPGGSTDRYDKGSVQAQWLSDAIDSARAAGIRWIVVGMHEVCLTAGEMSCQIGTDLVNLLVAKKVDLVLQGHEHGYERSKQLAVGDDYADHSGRVVKPGVRGPGPAPRDLSQRGRHGVPRRRHRRGPVHAYRAPRPPRPTSRRSWTPNPAPPTASPATR